MSELAVVGIGLGDLGRLECRIADSIDGVRVVGGADPDADARDDFEADLGRRTFDTHEALLSAVDADAALVSTPHALHYDHASACLEHGLHVHLEKPMTTDLDDARTLVREARGSGLTLAVGYQRHFDRRFRELRRLIDEGRIGDPHMVACHLEQDWISWNRDRWRGDPDLSGGGQLYDSGSHLLDSLLWTTRSAPVDVTATVDRRDADVDVNSALAVTLDRDGDRLTASVGVSGGGSSGPDPGEAFHVWGTEGSLSFDGETIRLRERGTTYEATPPAEEFGELTERKLSNFVDAIRGDADLEITATDALRVVALTEAAYESAESGRRVAVDAEV